jgi:hypothetical protein
MTDSLIRADPPPPPQSVFYSFKAGLIKPLGDISRDVVRVK